MADAAEKTDVEWLALLSPERFSIMRRRGTEPAFAGKSWNTKAAGTFRCVGSGEGLRASDAEDDSRSS